MVDGRIYGFPTNAAVNGIWFHKDVLDAAGVAYPKGQWKWDQLIPLAQKLTIRDERGRVLRYGFLCDWDQNWMQFVMQNGGRFYSDDGSRCVIDSPQAAEAMHFLHDTIYKYRIAPNPTEELAMATQGGWGSGTITLFAAKRGALAVGARWWLCTLRDYRDLKLGAAEAPYSKVHVFRGYGKATLINRASPHRQQALHFLQYQSSEAYNNLINKQADGLGPMIRYTQTESFLHDPDHPEEDYNAVWRDLQRDAVPNQVSPFVDGPTISRLILKQLDLMRGNDKTIEAGLASIAKEVNAHIKDMTERDPAVKKRYDALHTK
jgi:ABC-type glycerol-3-phosphate transport system substrate-binding protein